MLQVSTQTLSMTVLLIYGQNHKGDDAKGWYCSTYIMNNLIVLFSDSSDYGKYGFTKVCKGI